MSTRAWPATKISSMAPATTATPAAAAMPIRNGDSGTEIWD
jgi:hypothetical protein